MIVLLYNCKALESNLQKNNLTFILVFDQAAIYF